MMYMTYNKDHIHHQLNVSKKWIFAYIGEDDVFIIILQRFINPHKIEAIFPLFPLSRLFFPMALLGYG